MLFSFPHISQTITSTINRKHHEHLVQLLSLNSTQYGLICSTKFFRSLARCGLKREEKNINLIHSCCFQFKIEFFFFHCKTFSILAFYFQFYSMTSSDMHENNEKIPASDNGGGTTKNSLNHTSTDFAWKR